MKDQSQSSKNSSSPKQETPRNQLTGRAKENINRGGKEAPVTFTTKMPKGN